MKYVEITLAISNRDLRYKENVALYVFHDLVLAWLRYRRKTQTNLLLGYSQFNLLKLTLKLKDSKVFEVKVHF